jgi:glutathione peroxidase-family protein
MGINAVGFGGFDQRIEAGARISAGWSIRKHPSVATDHEWPDMGFHKFVVNRHGAIANKFE